MIWFSHFFVDMNNIILALNFMTISQILISLVVIFSSRNPIRVKVISTIFLVGIFCYVLVLLGVYTYGGLIAMTTWVIVATVPSIIVLLVWVVLEERDDIPWILFALIGFDVLFEIYNSYLQIQQPAQYTLLAISSIKQLLIVGLALGLIWKGRKHDFIEMRFKSRLWIIAGLILFLLPTILTLLPAKNSGNNTILILLSCKILLVTFLANYFFIKFNPGYRLTKRKKAMAVKQHPTDHKISDLLKMMKEEKLYENHHLRIGTLAESLDLKEHQLRKKINQQLGYPNFNQFINQFRIEAAKDKLIAEPGLPVLSIALDVGFKSISAFNAAFLSKNGISPTVYRQQNLPEIEKS